MNLDQEKSNRNLSNVPGLRCYLLGTPRIEFNGQLFTMPRRQVRALLFYLAAHPQPVSRGKLSFIFWPNLPDARARRNLSRLLNQLKVILGRDILVEHAKDSIRLNQVQIKSDVIDFLSALASKNHGQAITIYGGTFLDGFSLPNNLEYERWMMREAHRLEKDFLSCLDTSIQDHFSQKRFPEAIDLARCYLEIDELAEPIHRKLIELYALIGDRAAAMAQYEQCLLVLERELGVDALPETQAVVQAVLRDQQFQIETSPTLEPRPTMSLFEIPFIGRQELISNLERNFALTARQRWQFIFLIGEPGIGKTRLLHHFIATIKKRCTVLQTTADQSMQQLPYQLVAQALRSGLEGNSIPSISHLPQISEAARILPELKSIYPGLPPLLPLDSESAHLRLFDALSQLTLGWVKADQPLLICLDDLHWADATSLQWLSYFALQIHNQPIMILATCRLGDDQSLEPLKLALDRQGLLTQYSIFGLNLSETEQVISTLNLPDNIDPDLIQRVWQQTAGNPFFIKEIFRSLIESGSVSWQEEGLPLPESVIQTVNMRLGMLNKVARQLLDAAAVIGMSFSYELVKKASGRSEGETESAVDELIYRNLLYAQNDEFIFQHEIIQMVVYRNLSQWRRQLLHHRVAKALAKLQPQSHVQLSRHYELGGQIKQAAEEAIRAGTAIKMIFAYQEALSHFNRALYLLDQGIVEQLGAETQVENWLLRIQALAERGWVYRLLGQMDAYEQDLVEEARIVENLGDQRARVHLYLREAALQRWWCRYDQALEAAQKGLKLNQEVSDPYMEARGWREIGLAYRERGDFSQAQPALAKALQVFKRMDDLVMQIHTLSNLSTLFGHQDDFRSAEDFANQAMKICDKGDLIFERRLPLGDLGAVTAGKGQWVLAQSLLNESLEIAHQIDDRTQEIFCLAHLGYVALRQRRTSQAQQHLSAALDLAKKINSCTEQSRLHLSMAQVHLAKGERQQASIHAETALQLASDQGRGIEIKIAHTLLQKI